MPGRRVLGVDARGKKIRGGDRVMDKQGRIYDVAAWTDKVLRQERVIRAVPLDFIPPFVLLKLPRIFRVRKSTEEGSKRRWTHLWNKYAKREKRKVRARRRKVENMPLRDCPVCNEKPEAVHFKLGTPVWKGKKLRVCTNRCARVIRKEVKTAIEYGVDRDYARLKAAYKYMKIGGQV